MDASRRTFSWPRQLAPASRPVSRPSPSASSSVATTRDSAEVGAQGFGVGGERRGHQDDVVPGPCVPAQPVDDVRPHPLVDDLGGEVPALVLHLRRGPAGQHARQEGLHVVAPVAVASGGHQQVWAPGQRAGDAPPTDHADQERQHTIPPGERPVDVEGGDVARDHGRGIVPAGLPAETATRANLRLLGRSPCHQLVPSGRPSSYPAALWMPTTAFSCSSAMEPAPA